MHSGMGMGPSITPMAYQIVSVRELLLGLAPTQENSGEERCAGDDQPLDAPQLNRLKIRVVMNRNQTHGQRHNQEGETQEKCAKRGKRQAEPLGNPAELQSAQKSEVFRPALGWNQIRPVTMPAADMAESGAYHKLGPATSTSFS